MIYGLYEYKNVLPIGLIYDVEQREEDIPEGLYPFDVQNYLYQKLTNQEDDILKKVTKAKIQIENYLDSKDVNFQIDIEGKSYLYFLTKDKMYDIFEIYVNGNLINIPTLNSYINTQYPNKANNGIIKLGLYENETVDVKIFMPEWADINDIEFATLDIKQYEQMFSLFENQESKVEVNNSKITVFAKTDSENKTIFLPITYDEGWKATLNGKDVAIHRVFDTYMAIDLESGENTIELNFTPKNLKLGIAISFATLVIVLLYIVFKKYFKNLMENTILHNIAYYLYIGLVIVFYLYVYANSIIQTMIDRFN